MRTSRGAAAAEVWTAADPDSPVRTKWAIPAGPLSGGPSAPSEPIWSEAGSNEPAAAAPTRQSDSLPDRPGRCRALLPRQVLRSSFPWHALPPKALAPQALPIRALPPRALLQEPPDEGGGVRGEFLFRKRRRGGVREAAAANRAPMTRRAFSGRSNLTSIS